MNQDLEQPKPREDVILRLREMAEHGTTVRDLVREIQLSLGCKDDVVVPVLWYLSMAFCLPLKAVLPVREWLGTGEDDAINALILPAIQSTRTRWLSREIKVG